MKYLLLLGIIFVSFKAGIANNLHSLFVKDSLQHILITTKDNGLKASLYYELASNENNPQQRYLFADSGYQVSLKSENSKYEGLNLFRMGNGLLDMGNPDSALVLLLKANKIADKNAIPEIHYEADKDIAYIFEMQGNIDSALYYYKRSYNNSKSLDADKQLYGLYNIADITRVNGKYEDAMNLFIQCLELNKNRHNKIGVAINGGLGILFFKIKNYRESEIYSRKAIQIADTLGLTNYSQIATINLSQTLIFEKTKSREAVGLLTKLLNNEEQVSTYNLGLIYSNLSQAYINLHDLDKAMYYAKKGIKNAKKMGNRASEVIRSSRLIEIYFLKGEYKKSMAIVKKYQGFLEKSGDISSLIVSKQYLVRNQLHLINDQQLINDFDDYIKLQDSLYNQELLKATKEAEEKYYSKQKEFKILKLSTENINKETELVRSRYIIYGGLVLLVLMIVTIYFIWSKQKQKQRLLVLESRINAGEKEKTRIGKELHDGIAGNILKIVYETEGCQIELSGKLLRTYNQVRHLSHQLDGSCMHNELFSDRLLEVIPENIDGVRFNLKLEPKTMILNEPYGTNVYRIVQELVTNNLKYAKANETTISISLKHQVLSVFYRDNGVGSNDFVRGNGYRNIEDRIKLLKGEIKIVSEINNGFEVQIKIPFDVEY